MYAKTTLKKRAAVLLTATGILLSVGSGVALAANVQGTDREDTLIGTRGDDTLEGYKSNDLIKARPGNDKLDGGPNKDSMFGGTGRDVLTGGFGDDRLDAGSGHDKVRTAFDGGDRDVILCGRGTDTAVVDQFDVIRDASCETVTIREATVAPEPAPEEEAPEEAPEADAAE